MDGDRSCRPVGALPVVPVAGENWKGWEKRKLCIDPEVGGPIARQRLDFLAQNRDGFRIAEEDYRLRGPGDILGEDQSGIPRFRFARLPEDFPLLQVAQQEAIGLMKGDWPPLTCPRPSVPVAPRGVGCPLTRGDWKRWKGLIQAEARAKKDIATN